MNLMAGWRGNHMEIAMQDRVRCSCGNYERFKGVYFDKHRCFTMILIQKRGLFSVIRASLTETTSLALFAQTQNVTLYCASLDCQGVDDNGYQISSRLNHTTVPRDRIVGYWDGTELTKGTPYLEDFK
jgi:hypothetical protein